MTLAELIDRHPLPWIETWWMYGNQQVYIIEDSRRSTIDLDDVATAVNESTKGLFVEFKPIETAPKDELVFVFIGEWVKAYWTEHLECWTDTYSCPLASAPTHWTKIPSPVTECK